MIPRNLRHLRMFLVVAETGAVTRAAERCNVSQPAVTQAMAKLEQAAGTALLARRAGGRLPTQAGAVVVRRAGRALAGLDAALVAISPRLLVTATDAQLRALVAACEAENTALAARRLGRAQPTVHRALDLLEQGAGRPLFEARPYGLQPTRPARALAVAARLAWSELEQGEAELEDLAHGTGGRAVIGAMPLSRSALLPAALTRLRTVRPGMTVTVLDGSYADLLTGLRRGELDVIVGALRDPVPTTDILQERLFDDRLIVLARPGHPLAARRGLTTDDLRGFPWAVPRAGTPARAQFDAAFARVSPPDHLIETGSILLMRELIAVSDLLGCISAAQAEAELRHGVLHPLDVAIDWPARAIGLATRRGWVPTASQACLLDILRAQAANR